LIEKPFHGAGKGGTTHDFNDCWFLGYNQRVTCGVWTGFLTPGTDPIHPGAFSRDLAMPVWQSAMNAAAPSFGGGGISPPPDVAQVTICSVSGQRATQFCHQYIEDSVTGIVQSRSTAVNEFFGKGSERLPFCSEHSGLGGDASIMDAGSIALPALDVVPVRPTAPVLIGDDPYHTELSGYAGVSGSSGLGRRRTNVLDSLDLGEIQENIPLLRPGRLEILDE
jgi:penicillin-binding protein 1A